MKRKLLFLFTLILFLTGSLYAQTTINATTYAFSAVNSSSAVPTTTTTLIGSNADNVASAVTDIGFTFWFAGTSYTQFSVSENGWKTLGSTPISGNDITNNMASGTTLPKIAPYWDDLATGLNGSVKYIVTGTAPARILTVSWNVTVPKNTAINANTTFFAQLYEQGGIVFSFSKALVPVNNNQYTMGIGTSASNFGSVTVTSTSQTCSYVTSANANTASPSITAFYKRYQFTADVTLPTVFLQGGAILNTAGTANRVLTATISD